MQIEHLERRQLLAGNVQVSFQNGFLTVRGDAQDNYVVIRGAESGGGIVIQPGTGTSLNGRAPGKSIAFAKSPVNGMDLDLGAGYWDELILIGFRAGGESRITIPAPTTQAFNSKNVEIHRCRFSNLYIDGDTSPSTSINRQRTEIALLNSTIAGTFRLDLVNGMDDILGVRDTRVGGGIQVTKRASRDLRATFRRVDAGGVSSVSTSGGNDKIELLESTFDRLSIKTRAGNDTIIERNTHYRVASSFDAGVGDNHLDRELSFAWDFGNRRTFGWTPGMVSNEIEPESVLTSAQIMERLGVTASVDDGAYRFSSADHTFNDYVFVQKRLCFADGLMPGQKYRLAFTFSVDRGFETSPRVGGTGFWQQPIRNPSAGSRQMVLNVGPEDATYVPAAFTNPNLEDFSHTHATPVRPDARGFLWLHMGASRHAGLIEGTPAFAFRRVEVTLTPAS